jgi:hypothetical protein
MPWAIVKRLHVTVKNRGDFPGGKSGSGPVKAVTGLTGTKPAGECGYRLVNRGKTGKI